MANGEPTSTGRSGPSSPSSHRARTRAALLDRDTGRPSTRSMSTARQTVWLETRVVPLTNLEWPERRQLRRMAWRSARTGRNDWTRRASRPEARGGGGWAPAGAARSDGPRRSSRPEARSAAGSQPWLVVVVMRGLATRARTNGAVAGVRGGGALGEGPARVAA